MGDPLSQRKRRVDVVKNSFNGRHVFNKSLNEDPRLLVIIQGMPMRRVPFTQEEAEARSRTPYEFCGWRPKELRVHKRKHDLGRLRQWSDIFNNNPF